MINENMKIRNTAVLAAKKYYKNLPYHNFRHALEVTRNATKLVKMVRKHKKTVDATVVYHAALFHDAYYYKDHKKLGYKSKEHLSSEIASKELQKLGYSKDHISRVMKAILATNRNIKPKTVEQKILRASDLRNIQRNYKEFMKGNMAFKKECEILQKRKIPDKLWKEMTKEGLGHYLKEKIKLTEKFYDKKGRSAFHVKSQRNIDRYLRE